MQVAQAWPSSCCAWASLLGGQRAGRGPWCQPDPLPTAPANQRSRCWTGGHGSRIAGSRPSEAELRLTTRGACRLPREARRGRDAGAHLLKGWKSGKGNGDLVASACPAHKKPWVAAPAWNTKRDKRSAQAGDQDTAWASSPHSQGTAHSNAGPGSRRPSHDSKAQGVQPLRPAGSRRQARRGVPGAQGSKPQSSPGGKHTHRSHGPPKARRPSCSA